MAGARISSVDEGCQPIFLTVTLNGYPPASGTTKRPLLVALRGGDLLVERVEHGDAGALHDRRVPFAPLRPDGAADELRRQPVRRQRTRGTATVAGRAPASGRRTHERPPGGFTAGGLPCDCVLFTPRM